MISRSEGYRRGSGKEEGGLAAAEVFFEQKMGIRLARITDATDNYVWGDFVAPSGATIECKRQPIDPDRYRNNFVEVCELTNNVRHAEGFRDLVDLLGISESALAGVRVRVPHGRDVTFGTPRYVSVSIRSMTNSALTVYVNPQTPAHIYVYPSTELVLAIRDAIRYRGMGRGIGRSNEDTMSVFVPIARYRWTAPANGLWSYNGDGSEAEALRFLSGLLS